MPFSSNNRRIAKNTIVLTLRMFVTMIISFFTSRILLDNLGVTDFGVYSVVAGVISMFSFLKNNMEVGTQRFLNYYLGKSDYSVLNKVFSTSVAIYFIIAIAIVIVGEPVGVYFLNNKLDIPPDRLFAAKIVFQFTVVSSFISIISTPYSALIIAYEKMSVYAYMSIFDAIYLLVISLLLPYISWDSLITYGLLVCILSLLTRVIYGLYCTHAIRKIKFTFSFDKGLFKEMFAFSGWTMTGGFAHMLYNQGLIMVINIFFGPLVNAAQSLASRLSIAMRSFCSNFIVATKPQITKYYASGSIKEMERLVYISSKLSYYIMACVTIPFLIRPDYILDIWLKEVPEHTTTFVRLSAIIAFYTSLTQPVVTAIHSTGKIKKFQIIESMTLMMIIPTVYIFFRLGYSPSSAYIIMLFWLIMAQLVRVYFTHKLLSFSIKRYLLEILVPMTFIYAFSFFIVLRITDFIPRNLIGLILVVFTSIAVVSSAFFIIGLKKSDRNIVWSTVSEKLGLVKNNGKKIKGSKI